VREEALVILPLLVLLPAIVLLLISRFSGWHALAETYPLLGRFPTPRKTWGFAVFRGWFGYNGGIILAGDEAGLYLKTWPVILAFHPPVFIPWSEIREIEPPSGGFGASYRIRTARAPRIDFGLRAGTFDVVREDAKRAGVPGGY
jgi:hypothetical protein